MNSFKSAAILMSVAGLLLSAPSPGKTAQAASGQRGDPDRQACVKQLEQIHKAIQAYRKDHKDLPEWLSDLAPKYLEDKDALICPVTKKTDRTHTFEHLKDPKMPKAYLYEFSLLPMGDVWAGGQIRMRDFKRRQMGLIGGEVPIVRCHLHDPVLNLAFSGHVYDSTMNWEEKFSDLVEFTAWQMGNLFPDVRRAAARPQPRTEAEDSGPESLVGSPAPEFSLPLLEGGTFELTALKGKKIVLLDFWATWCGPCRVAMPALVEIAKEYANKGVQYYAVNLRERPETIRGYLKEEKLDILVPLDKDGSIAKKYGVRGIPTMVIVGKDGQVKKVHVGSSPTLKADLSRELDQIVGN